MSGDAQGNIYVWDVMQARLILTLGGSSSGEDSSPRSGVGPVTDLIWHPARPNVLLSLHSQMLSAWDLLRKEHVRPSFSTSLTSSIDFHYFSGLELQDAGAYRFY